MCLYVHWAYLLQKKERLSVYEGHLSDEILWEENAEKAINKWLMKNQFATYLR